MLEYEIFEGNFQTLLSRCVLGKTFLPLFLCHCLATNTGEVGIAPRTAAIAVLTSQTVAEELDRGLLEDFNGKTPATHANAIQPQSKSSDKARDPEVLLLFFFW